MDIRGKCALVTGAGGGIGRATALAVAAKGAAKLHLMGRRAGPLEETAALVRARGAEAMVWSVDVSHGPALEQAFLGVQAVGPLDIVFNNAGVVTGQPMFPDNDLALTEKIIAINLTAVVVGTQLAVRAMAGRGGVVVNMSSMVALGTTFPDYLYTLTKTAVLNFTQICAPLLASHGVRVTAVLPGLVDTPLIPAMGALADRILETNVPQPPGRIAEAVVALIEDETNAGGHVIVAHPPGAPS